MFQILEKPSLSYLNMMNRIVKSEFEHSSIQIFNICSNCYNEIETGVDNLAYIFQHNPNNALEVEQTFTDNQFKDFKESKY